MLFRSHLKEPGLHAVGGVDGLFIKVFESGGRSWVLRYSTPEVRYSKAGKPYRARRDLGLGSYGELTLKEAREKAREYRAMIRDGVDPVEQRQEARREWAERVRRSIPFREAAVMAFEAKRPEFRNQKHAETWLASLEKHAFPTIGEIPVDVVDVNHVLTVLRPLWEDRTDTATRVRQRLESVFSWARAGGYRSGDNPAEWKGNLDHLLPNPSKLKAKREREEGGKRHQPSLPRDRMAEFMAELRGRPGMSARALEFQILTATRPGEVVAATWDEVDLQAAEWTIPGHRMKGGKPHRVPLPPDAVALLESLPRMAGSELVFTSPRGGGFSNAALLQLVKRINKGREAPFVDPDQQGRPVVPHGFRASFKSWAQSRTGFPDEVSELQLAHVNDDATRAAYARGSLIDQRRRLMEEWAQFCQQGHPPAGTVTDIGVARG